MAWGIDWEGFGEGWVAGMFELCFCAVLRIGDWGKKEEWNEVDEVEIPETDTYGD